MLLGRRRPAAAAVERAIEAAAAAVERAKAAVATVRVAVEEEEYRLFGWVVAGSRP